MKTDTKLAVLIYAVCTAIYAVTAAGRLRGPSSDTHFVWMAEGWLQRRLDLPRPPPHGNDWAEVEHLTLRDGSRVAGAFQRAVTGRFRTLDGKLRNIPDADIVKRDKKYYVSFPPMPAVLMLPFVALFKLRTNDVIFTVALAGLAPALSYLVLRRLRGRRRALDADPAGRAGRVADLWLTGVFAVGSVFYFSAVQGQVWFTAHVVSQVLAAGYLLCALEARRPIAAGLLLGALMLTRPQMVFFGLLLGYEAYAVAWRAVLVGATAGPATAGPAIAGAAPAGVWAQRLRTAASWPVLRPLLLAIVPFSVLAGAGFVLNYLRFHNPLEFGHLYLTTMQADNIQRYGLFNYQYLSRNLAAAFTLFPKLLATPPYLQISYHGVSLLLTTPVLAYLLWPEPLPAGPAGQETRERTWALWLSVLPIAVFGFLYQNDGYIQFGFRFSLDYMLLLLLLLALRSSRAVGTWRFRGLVLAGVVVNLFGAVTFGRMWQFYYNGFFPVA